MEPAGCVNREGTGAIVVDFPLRGEWTAYHTPAEKVPSHGTDQLGQRYAYDFVRFDRPPAFSIDG